MNWTYAYPWVFWLASLVILVALVRVVMISRRRGIAVPAASSRLRAAGSSFRSLLRPIPTLLTILALLVGLVALARPREIISDSKSSQDAIALQLVVDRSGSMDEPAAFKGEQTNRLEAVKKVVEQFVVGDGKDLRGREGDLLGLIVFGTFADTIMPLTQSHEALVEALRRIELPTIERERSTAIGDALILACARLKASEDAMRAELDDEEFELKSKAVVLLTDGENRAGDFTPDQAASLAKDWGIKIYIIGIRGGTTQAGGFFRLNMGQEVNEERMSDVAEYTGGHFWGVDSLDQLTDVYAAIDELERTEIRVSESTRYEERFKPYAIASMLLLVGAYLSRAVFGSEVV